MKILHRLALVATGFLGAAPVTAATVYRLDATILPQGNSLTGDFWLTFDDLDADHLFSLNELISFSGVVGLFFYDAGYFEAVNYATISLVPDADGFLDGGGTDWVWTGDGVPESRTGGAAYSYRLSAVPLPMPGMLLLGAIAGLAAMHRRRRRLG